MSDYTPPTLVKPTSGGAAGDGTLGGALTIEEYASGPSDLPNGTALLQAYQSKKIIIITGANATQTGVQADFCYFSTADFGANGGFALSYSPAIPARWGGISTVGLGAPPIYGAGLLTSLGTTSTTVAAYTPTSSTGQSFEIKWRLSCVTASTPTLTLTYTDPKAGAQTITLYNSAMSASTVASGSYPLVATSAAAITVSGKDGTAADYIYATVEILQYQ